MKSVKKWLALLLALVMLFSLCACSTLVETGGSKDSSGQNHKNEDKNNQDQSEDKTDNKDENDDALTEIMLKGDWTITMDVDAVISLLNVEDVDTFHQLGIEMGTCTLNISFNDGEAVMKTEAFADWYMGVIQNVVDWAADDDNLLKLVAAMMSEDDGEKYTVQDIRDMLEEEGMDADDLYDEYFGELDMDELKDDMMDSMGDDVSSYRLDGNKLIFDDGDEIWTVTYTNNRIDVTKVELEGETIRLNKGNLVMEKQSEATGNDQKLTNAKLEGDWEMHLAFNSLLKSGVMGEMPDIFLLMDVETWDLSMDLKVTFESGVMEADADGMAVFAENLLDGMMDWIAEGDHIYELLATTDNTMSAEEYKDYCDAAGISKKDLLDEMKAAMPDVNELFGDELPTLCFCYEVDGDKLYTWDEGENKNENDYFCFTYKDKVISVTKVVDLGETIELNDGDFTFKKK